MKAKRVFTATLSLIMAAFPLTAFGATVTSGNQLQDPVPLTSVVQETVTVDPNNPLGTALAGGYYSVDFALENGSNRTAYQYVPKTVGYRQPEVAIAVPSGAEAGQFILDSGWKAVADENGICLVLMTAENGAWKADESAYTDAVVEFMDGRKYLQTQDSAFYMAGYGDGANTVMSAALDKSELFAGFAAFGVDNFDVRLLEAAKSAPSNAKGVMKSEVAVPMWIGAESVTQPVNQLVEFWKQANSCGNEVSSNQYASMIYQPVGYLAKTNQITYQDCSKVMVTLGLDQTQKPEFTSNLYNNFLKRTRRQDSGDINALRAFGTNAERGIERKTMKSNGTLREFYVYVPTAVKNGSMKNVPVVFAFHGGGGSGEEFAARSGWDKVAEERNFIVVFPTGCRSDSKFKASTTWKVDDLPFFSEMRAYMLRNYSIDASRIYVSGQSMGCFMSSTIALTHPEWIAACAATSARVMPSETANVNTSLVMPYMWSVGEKDKYFVEGGKDYGKVPACIGEWRVRYDISADESNTYTYQNGNFHGYDFKNTQGITLVREQWVKDKIHAMLPDEVYTLYDFMSSYSRGSDGTSYYMNMPITGTSDH